MGTGWGGVPELLQLWEKGAVRQVHGWQGWEPTAFLAGLRQSTVHFLHSPSVLCHESSIPSWPSLPSLRAACRNLRADTLLLHSAARLASPFL